MDETLDSGRNAKAYVGSIIGDKLRKVINKTSTKWMGNRLNTQDGAIRPHTTNKIETRRFQCQTVHKDSVSNKHTDVSTGATGSKKGIKPHKKYAKINSFLMQDSWIPNSYR